MSTYDMIVKEGESKAQKVFEELLAKERLRAEEEHRLLVAALQREEETRLILDNAILNLHLLSKMQPAEIAVILSTEVGYVEELILKNEQKEE